EGSFPQELARGLIECAEFSVIVRCANKEQTAGRDDGSAVILRARVSHALRRKFRIFAQVNFPDVLAGVQVDCVQGAPRRGDRGVAVGIQEPTIPGQPIFHRSKGRFWTRSLFVFASEQKIDQGVELILVQVWKARHAALALSNGARNLGGTAVIADSDQRRKRRWRPRHRLAMTDTALTHVNSSGALFALIFEQRTQPRHFVGINVNNPSFRIHNWTTPFGATVESGKNKNRFSYTEEHELPFVPYIAKLLDCPLMHFRRTIRKSIETHLLSRVRRRFGRQPLFCRGHLARDRASGIFLVLDWEQWPAARPVENIYKSLFAGLDHCLDVLTSLFQGHKDWGRWKVAVPKIVPN